MKQQHLYIKVQKNQTMPCIKKRSSKIKFKKKTPKVDMEKVLKETFTLKDFLNCEKTSQILQDNWYLDFTSKYEGKLEELLI